MAASPLAPQPPKGRYFIHYRRSEPLKLFVEDTTCKLILYYLFPSESSRDNFIENFRKRRSSNAPSGISSPSS